MRRALWPNCSEARHRLEIEQLNAFDGGGTVLVVEKESGSLCGFAEISIRHDHVDGAESTPIPYLEGWYIDAAFRNQGTGRKLLEAAERWAASRGFTQLASDAELENVGSIRAHLRYGFTETCREVHFIKRIPTERILAGLSGANSECEIQMPDAPASRIVMG